jgi:hypothetical protein
MNPWISVNDHLPKEKVLVLITHKPNRHHSYPTPWIAYLDHDTADENVKWISPWQEWDIVSVTHWMPLPNPPEDFI